MYLLRQSGEVVREQNDVQLVRSASLLAHAAGLALRSGDEASLHRLAHDAADGAPLLYVVVSDVSGKTLASAEHKSARLVRNYGKTGGQSGPVQSMAPHAELDASGTPLLIAVTYPISTTDAPPGTDGVETSALLGYVRTGMHANTWHQTMADRVNRLIGIAAIALLAAVPIGFLAIRKIIAPLRELADVMHLFSHGRLDARAATRRQDEIGRLAAAFNRMADQHQNTHERALQLNSELEQRVAQRTRQLRELASREPLTGLYNRRHFNEVLERGFAEARRYGQDLSCLMIDLDGFKSANDRLGHLVGDELLILTATTIVRELRAADVAARYGGDEFVALLPQTDDQNARVLAERIMSAYERELPSHHPTAGLSMSIGIASIAATATTDPEDLLRAADQALYSAKRAGKNRVVVASGAGAAISS